MSDQPKPASGEWTAETVQSFISYDYTLKWCAKVADAHNSALAAAFRAGASKLKFEAEDKLDQIGDLQKQLAAFREGKARCEKQLNATMQQLTAERERTAKAQAEYQTAWKEMQMQRESREDYQGEAYELNLQLAAEREKYRQEAVALEQMAGRFNRTLEQLAAERRNVRPMIFDPEHYPEDRITELEQQLAAERQKNWIRAEDNPGFHRHE